MLELARVYQAHGPNVRQVRFANSRNGWMIAGDRVLTTIDGGHNWRVRTLSGVDDQCISLRSLYPITEKECWLLGTYLDKEVLCFRTLNGGQSWTQNRR